MLARNPLASCLSVFVFHAICCKPFWLKFLVQFWTTCTTSFVGVKNGLGLQFWVLACLALLLLLGFSGPLLLVFLLLALQLVLIIPGFAEAKTQVISRSA